MNWISVETQLPPENVPVLAVFNGGHLNEPLQCVVERTRMSRHVGKDFPIDDRYWVLYSRAEVRPTYWMPLPDLPE